jgi:hypothetical protein
MMGQHEVRTTTRKPAGSVTRYEYGKRPGGKRKCGPILVLRCGGQGHYGVIRKLHPRRAATRGVLLGRLRSYERRGSARQTGLRPYGSLGGISARCERYEPRVGPPNRASPMRGFVIALGTQERHRRCRSWTPNGASPVRARSQSLSARCERCVGRQTGFACTMAWTARATAWAPCDGLGCLCDGLGGACKRLAPSETPPPTLCRIPLARATSERGIWPHATQTAVGKHRELSRTHRNRHGSTGNRHGRHRGPSPQHRGAPWTAPPSVMDSTRGSLVSTLRTVVVSPPRLLGQYPDSCRQQPRRLWSGRPAGCVGAARLGLVSPPVRLWSARPRRLRVARPGRLWSAWPGWLWVARPDGCGQRRPDGCGC